MNVKISKYAKDRAAERGITENGIRSIVGGDQSVATIPSNSDPDVVIFLGLYENKVWAVIINVKTLNVVTVRRADERERLIYDQET